MKPSAVRRWAVLLLIGAMGVPLAAQPPAKAGKPRPDAAPAPPERPNYEAVLEPLRWREIGPANMGGRIDDFAVVESNPNIVYAGTASGGVWKTTNGGTTWEPVFDNEAVSTIGDLAVAPADPSVVWVGTGEPNNRQSSSWGNGVYKSADGGRTWQHTGLRETHHIGRILIHPRNPEVVYVAAVGRLWGPNKERGVFKTVDGGRTWTHILFLNEDTGVVDLAMDPQSPDTLFAAAYQRRRSVSGFAGSGPGSALYKSTDGGANWRKLTRGLPYEKGEGETGRIGVQVYRGNPNIVYALVEHRNGGTFRSDDRGETWTRMSETNPRPMYYSQIHIDPNNDLRIWVLGAPVYTSEDGGKTFVTTRGQRIHGDYHAMWINPANSQHMIVGTDGGIHWTWDGGRSWDFVNTLALGQFYEIGVDLRDPYFICGGLQDNGSWCGPSRTWFQQGIANDDWVRVGSGDGFYVQIDPADPATLYAESQDGNLIRRDLRTGESRPIRPREKDGEARYRFQWNSPIVISAHDAKTIYYGGNFLFKSTDRGDTWTKISPDLTTGQDRDKLPIMGRVPDAETRSRHDGVVHWPAITTVSESPLTPQLLWVGTDDGNLQITRDAGAGWRNVAGRVPGVPPGTYVSRVVASRHAEGTAYATFDGHRQNDFNVYVYATTDYGETWKPISSGIPNNLGVVNVIREHPRNPSLLFVGTEYGAHVSFDRGASWSRLKMNLPVVPVDDIVIHPRENDLIFGTHGRSIWVLDDITPLEQLSDKVLAANLHLFAIRPAKAWRMSNHKGNTGHKTFLAPNPPYGALVHYYLRTKPDAKEKVRLTILDRDAKVVRELDGTAHAGINRVNWDLRYNPPREATPEEQQALAAGFGFGARGPLVDPGEYTAKVTLGAAEASVKLQVQEDPRVTLSAADRAERRRALNRLYEMARSASRSQQTITGLRSGLEAERESWKKPGAPKVAEEIQKAAEEFKKNVDEVHGRFVAPPRPMGDAGPAPPPLMPQRINMLLGALDGYTAAPTAPQLEEIESLAKQLDAAAAAVRKLAEEDLPALNKKMNEAGLPHVRIEPPARPGGQRQR